MILKSINIIKLVLDDNNSVFNTMRIENLQKYVMVKKSFAIETQNVLKSIRDTIITYLKDEKNSEMGSVAN